MKIDSFTGQYRFLSNFYPSLITYEGIDFRTVEHAFQAAKTFDLSLRRTLAAIKWPRDAKSFGRSMPLRPDWDAVRLDIMEELCFLKFSTYEDLKTRLLATGEAYLEEGNHHGDTFYGTVDGEGENKIGFILMRVRDRLKTPIVDPTGFKAGKKRRK